MTTKPAAPAPVDGVGLIAAERQRQVNVEGYTPECDDQHGQGQLATAAACYAAPETCGYEDDDHTKPRAAILAHWPWAAAPRGEKVRIRQEVAVSMTRAQVAGLIASVEGNVEPQANDVAFVFDRDPAEHWLSNSIPTSDVDVPVEKVAGVFSADQLALTISRRAARLFGALG